MRDLVGEVLVGDGGEHAPRREHPLLRRRQALEKIQPAPQAALAELLRFGERLEFAVARRLGLARGEQVAGDLFGRANLGCQRGLPLLEKLVDLGQHGRGLVLIIEKKIGPLGERREFSEQLAAQLDEALHFVGGEELAEFVQRHLHRTVVAAEDLPQRLLFDIARGFRRVEFGEERDVAAGQFGQRLRHGREQRRDVTVQFAGLLLFNHRRRAGRELGLGQRRERVPRREDRMRVARGVFEVTHPALEDAFVEILRLGEDADFIVLFLQLACGGEEVLLKFVGRAELGAQRRDARGEKLIEWRAQGGDLALRAGFDGTRRDLGQRGQRARAIDGQARGGEEAVERVIILRADGVVLVIVTARALHRDAEQAARDDVDLVVDHVGQRAGEPAADREKTERRLLGGPCMGILIGGELQRDEAIVGQVFIQRVDDPVAIGVGEGPALLFGRADPARVAVARDIEPMPRPMHAVLARLEEALDDFGEGVRRRVGEEGVDLLGGGRQAGERVGGAAQERGFVGGRRGRELRGVEFREDELINGIARPRRRFDPRWCGFFHRSEAPVLPRFREVLSGFDRRGGAVVAGIRRAEFHPCDKILDLVRGELVRVLGRHLQVFVDPANGADQQAAAGIAGQDHAAGAPAGEQQLAAVEAQLALLLFAAVTFEAAVDQDGADFVFKKLHARAGRVGLGGGDGGQRCTEESEAPQDGGAKEWERHVREFDWENEITRRAAVGGRSSVADTGNQTTGIHFARLRRRGSRTLFTLRACLKSLLSREGLGLEFRVYAARWSNAARTA